MGLAVRKAALQNSTFCYSTMLALLVWFLQHDQGMDDSRAG